ncbi:MAG: TraR/DksA family transcriptional regulator [Bacteroidales bacterium]|nr:TraR/DksA family transcriptional regulator [Bacteroidales bacterium]
MAEPTIRYSDEELQEFKVLIEEKIAKARADMQVYLDSYNNAGNDTMDTSPTFKNLEDGNQVMSKEENARLALRLEKYIKNLDAALVRIENKTYGICRITGKLIPKERLDVVPHATSTLDAKIGEKKVK